MNETRNKHLNVNKAKAGSTGKRNHETNTRKQPRPLTAFEELPSDGKSRLLFKLYREGESLIMHLDGFERWQFRPLFGPLPNIDASDILAAGTAFGSADLGVIVLMKKDEEGSLQDVYASFSILQPSNTLIADSAKREAELAKRNAELEEIATQSEEEALRTLVKRFPYMSLSTLHTGYLHMEGKTGAEMEKLTGVGRTTVYKRIKDFYEKTKLPRPDRRGSEYKGRPLQYDEERDGKERPIGSG